MHDCGWLVALYRGSHGYHRACLSEKDFLAVVFEVDGSIFSRQSGDGDSGPGVERYGCLGTALAGGRTVSAETSDQFIVLIAFFGKSFAFFYEQCRINKKEDERLYG